MIYCKHTFCPSWNKYVANLLASWHGYKHVGCTLWNKNLSNFFGAMYHHLYPEFNIPTGKGVRIRFALKMFTILRLSYSLFKNDLQRALARDDLDKRHRTWLVNLQDLIEFFIPVV